MIYKKNIEIQFNNQKEIIELESLTYYLHFKADEEYFKTNSVTDLMFAKAFYSIKEWSLKLTDELLTNYPELQKYKKGSGDKIPIDLELFKKLDAYFGKQGREIIDKTIQESRELNELSANQEKNSL